MGSKVGESVVIKMGAEYESDVSDSGTAVGSEIISSPSRSSSSMSLCGEGEMSPSPPVVKKMKRGEGRGQGQGAKASSSSESLGLGEQLYFIPRKGKKAGKGVEIENGVRRMRTRSRSDADDLNCYETTQEVLSLPGGVEVEDANVKSAGGPGGDEDGMVTREMTTPNKRKATTVPEPPKKKETVPVPCQPTRGVRSEQVKKLKVKMSKSKQRKQRQRPSADLSPSPSTTDLREVQKIALRVVRNRMKPVENLLASITESIRLHVTNTVREEIEGAFEEFRTFLDGRLPVPKPKGNKGKKAVQPKQQRKKKGQKEAVDKNGDGQDKEVRDNQETLESTGNDNQKGPEEDDKITDNCSADDDNLGKSTADNCSTEAETSSPSQSSPQELTNKRIIWANKRMRSETLVDKLKKYMEQKGEDLSSTPERSFTSDSSGEMFTPPNSPMSGNSAMTGSSTPAFTLGMVKLEPIDADFSENVPDGGNAMIDPLQDVSISNPCETMNSDVADFQSSAPEPIVLARGNRVPSRTGLRREIMPKPELPIGKPKESIRCHVCAKIFLNNSSLKQHISFHRPQRPFNCDSPGCEKSYKTKSELNRHVIVHTGVKDHECKQCGKKFLRKQYLKTHLLRHIEPLTKKCPLCSKIFVSEEDLNKHKISYHKNGKRRSTVKAS